MEEREVPKIFWKYYDLFRRNLINLDVFSEKTALQQDTLLFYLREIEVHEKNW